MTSHTHILCIILASMRCYSLMHLTCPARLLDLHSACLFASIVFKDSVAFVSRFKTGYSDRNHLLGWKIESPPYLRSCREHHHWPNSLTWCLVTCIFSGKKGSSNTKVLHLATWEMELFTLHLLDWLPFQKAKQ